MSDLRDVLDLENKAWDEYHAKKAQEFVEIVDKLKVFLYPHKQVNVWSIEAKGEAVEIKTTDKAAVEKILPEIQKIVGEHPVEILERGYPV